MTIHKFVEPAQVAAQLGLKPGDKVALLEKMRNPRTIRITAIGEQLVFGREQMGLKEGNEKTIPLSIDDPLVTWVKKL